MGARVDIPAGTRFGKLVVLGEGEPDPDRTLRCQCDCGSPPKDIQVRALRSQGRRSCSRSCAATVHGLAKRGNRDPIYNCWQSILARCENPKATGYEYWGGRGIMVHGPWHDPLVFKADVEREIGPRLSTDMTIERLDVNGHYVPGNIAWLSKSLQPLSRRQMYNATEVADLLARHHCAGCSCPQP